MFEREIAEFEAQARASREADSGMVSVVEWSAYQEAIDALKAIDLRTQQIKYWLQYVGYGHLAARRAERHREA